MCSKIQQNQEGGLLKEACSLLPKSSLHIFKLRQVHRQSRPVKRKMSQFLYIKLEQFVTMKVNIIKDTSKEIGE